MAHTIVKPQKLAATAIGLLDREVVVPQLFVKRGVEDFKGSLNDTLNAKVPGVLPGRTYAWRNDRSTPITFDEYAERTVSVTFGGHAYSAVHLTDEQNDFDLQGDFGTLLDAQTRAVGRQLEMGAVEALEDAPYEVTIGGAEADPSAAFVEARRVLNRFNVPTAGRYLLLGSDFDAVLQNDPDFNVASTVGDANADSALKDATIGRWKGFNIITSNEVDAATAYAFVPSAFIFLSAAPSVQAGNTFGANASFNNIAMRWVRDYDPAYLRDRSVVSTYYGFDEVTDVVRYWDADTGQEKVSTEEYFVRGVKLTLDGTSSYPEAGSELDVATGVTPAAEDGGEGGGEGGTED